MKNREELIEYIRKYNKTPGEYTLEELLDIGTQLKTLPVLERSWN